MIGHNPLSISQISPKSDILDLPDAENIQASSSRQDFITTQSVSEIVQSSISDYESPVSINESESESQRIRVERSASPILHELEHSSKIRFVDDAEKNHIDPIVGQDDASVRYYHIIQPTSTSASAYAGQSDEVAEMTKSDREPKDLSDKSFLLPGGPRSIPSGSPSRPLALANNSSINPSTVLPASTETATNPPGHNQNHSPRQNPNPDIQDIITGIVKLLNGKVNVHANTQLQPPASRRPYTTRINNRGPPRISEAQPLPIDNFDNFEQQLTSTLRPPPPPYPFDRPEGPVRPFMSGVPIPEQVVPPQNGNYRPGFVGPQTPNRPPWQRRPPRPPIVTNTNIRPILTPPPYKFSLPTSNPTLQQDEYLAEDEMTTDMNPSVDNDDSGSLEDNNRNQNATYEVNEPQTELLENEEFVQNPEYISTKAPATLDAQKKDDQSKKKDRIKKPLMPASVNDLSEMIKPTLASDMQMTTIIQTASEIRTSQRIPSSMITATNSPSDSSILQPSEDHSVKLSPSDIHLLETAITPIAPFSPPATASSSGEQKITPSQLLKTPSSTPLASPMVPPSFPTFHPRPGIVLDDPEFKPGGHARPHLPTTPLYTNAQPTRTVPQHPQQLPPHQHQPQQHLPPGYGEIFDVTLSAIQGPGNGANSGLQTINIKPYGAGTPGDIIVSPSGDDGFVSIDGKRTYINLFGEPTIEPQKEALAPTTTAAPSLPSKTQTINPSQVVNFIPFFVLLVLIYVI